MEAELSEAALNTSSILEDCVGIFRGSISLEEILTAYVPQH